MTAKFPRSVKALHLAGDPANRFAMERGEHVRRAERKQRHCVTVILAVERVGGHSTLTKTELSVVVPAYREAAHIRYNLLEICDCLDELHIPFEVRVVDDGSDDDTAGQVRSAMRARQEIHLRRLPLNLGKGFALLAGARMSEGRLVAFLDADLDLHPRLLASFIRIKRESGSHAVIGSKWHPESVVDYPVLRRMYSGVYYWLVYLLFRLPVRDTQTGIKLFDRVALLDAADDVRTWRYAFDLDLLVSLDRLGYRIVDAPVNLEFHRSVGRIKILDVLHIFKDTIAIYLRRPTVAAAARRPFEVGADGRAAFLDQDAVAQAGARHR